MTSYTHKPSPCSFYCNHLKKKHNISAELVEIVEMRLSDFTVALAIVAIIALGFCHRRRRPKHAAANNNASALS